MRLQSLPRSKSLVEQVYDRVLDAICLGTLGPEEHITQDSLAASLQVSRQPVITALGQLKQQGFLVERGKRGLRIAPLNQARLESIHEVRNALEPLAASLAAARASESDVAQARSIIERGRCSAAAHVHPEVLRADLDFSEWLYLASGNHVLTLSMQVHWPHLRRSMGELVRAGKRLEVDWSEHEAILDAIQHGEADHAAALVCARLPGHPVDALACTSAHSTVEKRRREHGHLPALAHTVYTKTVGAR